MTAAHAVGDVLPTLSTLAVCRFGFRLFSSLNLVAASARPPVRPFAVRTNNQVDGRTDGRRQ